MANLLDYAILADAVYNDDEKNVISRLVEGGCGDFSVRSWQARTSSNGFQGAILENDQEVICAFKGSKGGKSFVQDWLVNDMQIMINDIPNQAFAAAGMVKAALTISGAQGKSPKPLSLVGHSLGGGLAQLIGYFYGLPFVTFNAPGMKGNVELIPFLYRGSAPKGTLSGFNMILWTDPIGNYGRHLGKTERFMTPSAFNPFGGGGTIAHQMGNILAVLQAKKDWASKLLTQLL